MSLRVWDIERLHLQILAVAVVVATLTQWMSGWSLFLGGAVMGLNFWLMHLIFERLLDTQHRPQPGLVMGLLLAKLSLFLGLLALVFWRLPVDGLGFGVGVTILLVACVAAALRHQRQPA